MTLREYFKKNVMQSYSIKPLSSLLLIVFSGICTIGIGTALGICFLPIVPILLGVVICLSPCVGVYVLSKRIFRKIIRTFFSNPEGDFSLYRIKRYFVKNILNKNIAGSIIYGVVLVAFLFLTMFVSTIGCILASPFMIFRRLWTKNKVIYTKKIEEAIILEQIFVDTSSDLYVPKEQELKETSNKKRGRRKKTDNVVNISQDNCNISHDETKASNIVG